MDNITQSIISIDYRHNKQNHKAGHTFMSGFNVIPIFHI